MHSINDHDRFEAEERQEREAQAERAIENGLHDLLHPQFLVVGPPSHGGPGLDEIVSLAKACDLIAEDLVASRGISWEQAERWAEDHALNIADGFDGPWETVSGLVISFAE